MDDYSRNRIEEEIRKYAKALEESANQWLKYVDTESDKIAKAIRDNTRDFNDVFRENTKDISEFINKNTQNLSAAVKDNTKDISDFVKDNTKDLSSSFVKERRKMELRSEIGEHTRTIDKAYAKLGEKYYSMLETNGDKKELEDVLEVIRSNRKLVDMLTAQLNELEKEDEPAAEKPEQ
ncbi:MAG: hypothetical protein IKS32_12065 [Solobacterium sp.]|nr:hypothetical protein [Solobacterium sp.]